MSESEDPFEGIFGNLNGSSEERAKAARLEYEAFLADIRQMVHTHVEGFIALGFSREEALYFGGQLHVLLTQLNNR